MKRIGFVTAIAMAACLSAGSPAPAARHAARHTVSCKEIKDARAAGKSEDEVARDLNVKTTRVKSCTAPTVKHHHRATTQKPS